MTQLDKGAMFSYVVVVVRKLGLTNMTSLTDKLPVTTKIRHLFMDPSSDFIHLFLASDSLTYFLHYNHV